MPREYRSRLRSRATIATGLAIGLLAVWGASRPAAQNAGAQKNVRLNKIIEQLEQGKPAINGQHFRLIDMEHQAFSFERLERELAALLKDKDEFGRPRLTPFVRIPQEGDEDFRWSIKQTLDAGALAVMIPHMETKQDAVRAIRAMRYPSNRGWPNEKYPDPPGQRGTGPGRAAGYWNFSTTLDYMKKADVWPLNPEGELFLVVQIETGEGVKNVGQILQAGAGLGSVMITPVDLGVSLGVGPPNGAEMPREIEQAFQTVIRACLGQKPVTCGAADVGSRMNTRLKEGYKFLLPLAEAGAYQPQRPPQ
jgi:4-hydroxy-2-oxoheptanedioate aldolase